MKRVSFAEVFSVEYLEVIAKYKERINELLSTYDFVIFMARKAICFYKAMVINQEIIPNEKCIVLSSRALSYNIMDIFKGKKIAVVDDVVVQGKTISYSKKTFEKNGIDVDIYFVACQKEFIDAVDFGDSIKSSYIYLSDTNICQISNYIAEYIAASMVPYNVDQPIYTIIYNQKEDYEKNFLNINNISNITDGFQKRYDIQNLTIHFNPIILRMIFGDDFDVENAYLKIRFVHQQDSLALTAIPFVLLPQLSYEKLNEVFEEIFENGSMQYLSCGDLKEEYENKLKVLQYILSDSIFRGYSKTLHSCEIVKDLENEVMQFAELISNVCHNQAKNLFDNLSYADQIRGFNNHFDFDKILSDTYDYIFNNENAFSNFYDRNGNKQHIFTFSELTSYMDQVNDYVEKYSVSSIIDILIDKGILVPIIVHGANNCIIRGYRCGEIYNLTKKGLELFAYMLNQYAELQEGRPLDKIEFEKLCVLFFKKTAYKNRLFSVSKSFDDDCFSICYSKFGPRVSNCNKKYKVESHSALATLFEDYGKINLSKGKYLINKDRVPTSGKWRIIAENFALNYHNLYQCFESKTVRNKLVHTYNDFLTLLAIGSDRKNQMFSLMAELYLMTRIETDNSLIEILYELDHYAPKEQGLSRPQYQGIMDGIGSGIWKYSCFCQDDLMNSLFTKARQIKSDVRLIKEDYLTETGENDENPFFLELIDECGRLLYEIVYLFNYAQKRYQNEQMDQEMNRIFRKGAFYNTKFESMRHVIKCRCKGCTEDELIYDLSTLKKRALALINKCDLCIEDAAFNTINVHNDIWVLFTPEYSIPRHGLEINIQTNRENDLIKKCILLKYEADKDFEQQLREVIKRYEVIENKILLMLVNTENSYEGVFASNHTASGDYFKDIVRNVLEKNSFNTDTVANKVILCTRKEMNPIDFCLEGFVLKYECSGEIFDGYKYFQYILMKERMKKMESSNQGHTTNFNGPVTINGGVVGAIGGGSEVQQSINGTNDMEVFYKDVQSMNLEILSNDVTAANLAKEIQDDATTKNQEGVLTKLKKLAVTVGSSIFAKVVSTLVIDVMKAKGYFPF